MIQIINLSQRNQTMLTRLLNIWESAVIATHTFLSEANISALKPEVKQYLVEFEHLYGYYEIGRAHV